MPISLYRHALGSLEAELMHLLWAHGPMTVRQLYKLMLRDREIAYTTILTTSARMEEKGFITRPSLGNPSRGAQVLTPTVSRADLLIHIVTNAFHELNATDADRVAALAALARTLP